MQSAVPVRNTGAHQQKYSVLVTTGSHFASRTSSILDSLQSVMAPKAAKRKLSRQSTDVCVKRALKDNFSSEEWTPDLVYS